MSVAHVRGGRLGRLRCVFGTRQPCRRSYDCTCQNQRRRFSATVCLFQPPHMLAANLHGCQYSFDGLATRCSEIP